MEDELREMWRQYTDLRTDELRNRLVCLYVHLVSVNAERLCARIPKHADSQALFSAGTLGLIDAVEKFDPDRNILFQTYASRRIRGAMLDELRSVDTVPRTFRHRLRLIDGFRQSFYKKHGYMPTVYELRKGTGLSEDQVAYVSKWLVLEGKRSVSWVVGSNSSGEEVALDQIVVDSRVPMPFDVVNAKDVKRFLLSNCCRSERLVLSLHYYVGLNQKEIGKVLGCTESWVCLLHKKALEKIRKELLSSGTGQESFLSS